MKWYTAFLSLCLVFAATAAHSQSSVADSTVETDLNTFEKVEVEATYPGGEQGWRQFLQKNLNPNTPVDNGAPVGKYVVIIQFVVSKDGSVSDVKALTDFGYGLEKEVIQLLKKSGKWNPAMQNGKPVNAYRKQPVTFMVTADGMDVTTQTPYTLYTGQDNEITIKIRRVKGDDITAIISQGTIVPRGDGTFTAKVNKEGKAIITLFGKKDKELGRVFFEVRSPGK
jgi:hypothetical protein